jgi:hypothetical protein
MDRGDIMAEALYRYNEATTSWVQVTNVNRIEVAGTCTTSAGARLAIVELRLKTILVHNYLVTILAVT